jgi:hypothetical protein
VLLHLTHRCVLTVWRATSVDSKTPWCLPHLTNLWHEGI